VIGPYLRDRKSFVDTYLRPLRHRPEPIYVQSGTRAERVAARIPAKEVRYIDYKVGLASIDNAIRGLQHMFDARRHPDSDGLSVRCVVTDGTGGDGHEILLAVRKGALQRLDPDTDTGTGTGRPEPAATATGPLAAWMDLLTHAAAGHPTVPDDLTVTGDTTAFTTLVASLH
jgi:hypothetical protein